MSKNQIIAGIDIGTDKVCTLIASRSVDQEVTLIGLASTPSAGIRKSQIVDLEETIAAATDSVEAAERMAGYTINAAFVSISGIHIESINSKGVVAVSEPEGEIGAEDINRVIEAARAVSMPSSREIIHVIPRDYMVDGQMGIKDPLGMTGVRLEAEGHIITGSSIAIRNISKAVSELGISVSGLVYAGLASAHSVLTETEKELGVVLVDIGSGTTSLTAYCEGAIILSKVIPIGAKNITNDLAIGMRLSLSSAESVKIHLSLPQEPFSPPPGAKSSEVARLKKEHDDINLQSLGIKEEAAVLSRKFLSEGIIMPRLKELFSLIGQELDTAKLQGLTPAGLVITGGGAKTIGATDVAKRILGLPARVGIPERMQGLSEELDAPEYATAVGLLHHGIKFSSLAPQPRRGLPSFSKMPRIPVRSTYDKAIALIKNLLP